MRGHLDLDRRRGKNPLKLLVSVSLFGACAFLVACGDPGTSVAAPAVGFSVSGDGQIRFPGSMLLNSLMIRLVDSEGQSVQEGGTPVTWKIVQGSGSVGRDADSTGPNGMARTSWTLGPDDGTQRVEVTVGSFLPYVFTAEAVSAGPIAFLSNRRTRDQADGFRVMAGDVFVMEDDGSNAIQISPAQVEWDWLSDPSWAPDGQSLAYVRSPFGETSGPINVIGSDGSVEKLVGPDGGAGWFSGPAWSPDGRQLVAWKLQTPGLWIIHASANPDYTRLNWQDPSVFE